MFQSSRAYVVHCILRRSTGSYHECHTKRIETAERYKVLHAAMFASVLIGEAIQPRTRLDIVLPSMYISGCIP